MKRGKEAAYLIMLLHFGIQKDTPETPNILLNWEWVHEIARRHKVSYVAYDGLKRLPKGKKPPAEIEQQFEDDIEQMTKRNKMQIEEVDRLIVFFKKEQISFTLLYDWPMKELYPFPQMREVDVIDILIDVPIDAKMDDFMSSLGYDRMHKGVASSIYSNDPMIQVRLHSSLFWNNETLGAYYEDVWDQLEEIDGQEYIYRFSMEDFYILYIAHLAEKCKEASVDLRPFLDLWNYTQVYFSDLDWQYISQETEKLSLQLFNYRVMQLIEYWFGDEGEQQNATIEKFGEFVLQSGNYGREQTRMLIGIADEVSGQDAKNIQKAKQKYIRERLFLGKTEMKEAYGNLQEKPYLLPFYRIGRLSKGIFGNFKKTMSEYEKIQNATKSDIKQMSTLMKNLGIKKESVSKEKEKWGARKKEQPKERQLEEKDDGKE